jgi:uncharacterized protein YecA (UPF0149 family)
MNACEFLTAELDHAARQLARVRRIAGEMESQLATLGLDEVAVYEKLAASKAYRQLRRDEVTFLQMWLRVERRFERIPAPQPQNECPDIGNHSEKEIAAIEKEVAANLARTKIIPYRKPPTPGRNEKCPCGSNLKFKRCCGNPVRPAMPPRLASPASRSA